MDITFPSTYEESRARFIQDFERVRLKWPSSRLETYPLRIDPSLSIDYAWALPRVNKHLVIVSTGVHGIEGYVGSVMLKIFMDEFAPRLNVETTGLLLIHAVNPWGMKNRRRYNENNVDLNRNFIWNENFDPSINPDYEPLVPLVNPQRPLANLFLSDVAFLARLICRIIRLGIPRIRIGLLSGQYRHPRGVQFGGQSTQDSTRLMQGLFQQALDKYEQIVHFDMHTGYGLRYQMCMVNSTRASESGPELIRRFSYPLIVCPDPAQFYTVTGDLTEYFYQLHEVKFPSKRFFSTCFEFGTLGHSLPAQIRSMRATILENRVFHHGAKLHALRNAVRKEFEELFCPVEDKWRQKAMADCRQATEGVLRAYNLI